MSLKKDKDLERIKSGLGLKGCNMGYQPINKVKSKPPNKGSSVQPLIKRKVAYICDGRACGGECKNENCKHTFKIEHAKNFERIGADYFEKAQNEPLQVKFDPGVILTPLSYGESRGLNVMKEKFKNLRYRIAYKVAPDLIGDLEERLSGLLCHVTGGLLSKTNYPLKTMLNGVKENQKYICDKCEVKDVLQKEIEALRKRLQHLFKSDVIRSYDEYDRKTHDYAKDISEFDKEYRKYKEAYEVLKNCTTCNECGKQKTGCNFVRWGEKVVYNCPHFFEGKEDKGE